MNQQIVDYLKQHKDTYPKDSLLAKLKQHYPEEEVKEASFHVYGGTPPTRVNSVPKHEQHRGGVMVVVVLIIVIAAGVLIYAFLGRQSEPVEILDDIESEPQDEAVDKSSEKTPSDGNDTTA